ncbi:DUF6233 domain-containing protein [Streptomyces sp. NPDC056049]|uniref:DUF6233 domain-containing protein n=1 Tax=Streptomyces sp. NPDC056049 TaxID=3345693 RepID=UPI0035D93122
MGLPIAERLEKQRTLLEWLRYQVTLTERTIRDLEREEAEEKRRRDQARRETRWKLQPARAVQGHPMLHRGNCGQYPRDGGLLDRDEVTIAVEEFPGLEMCGICAPWGSLGIDKPAGPPADTGKHEVEFP